MASQNISSMREFAKIVDKIIIDIVQDVADLFVQYAMKEIESGSWVGTPGKGLVNFGDLKQNLRVKKTGKHSREVISDVPYAAAQNFGTHHFFPPRRPLMLWFLSKFTMSVKEAERAAYLLQQKIGREGLKPKPYFTRAFFNTVSDSAIEAILRKNGFT